MKILKRNGELVEFDKQKIHIAINKPNSEVKNPEMQVAKSERDLIIQMVEGLIQESNGDEKITVEDIQDIIEDSLIRGGHVDVAKLYIRYREKRNIERGANSTDKAVAELQGKIFNDLEKENSNKKRSIVSTQGDHVAGIVSKDFSSRVTLPANIVKAHEDGIIHFHDMDYFLFPMHNCGLVNLEDMLQNGTVMNEVKIDKPKGFLTACTVATQIVAQVASSQYGGQTITLSHLAPFVDASRQKFKRKVMKDFEELSIQVSGDKVDAIVERQVMDEIKSGVQTIQYQIESIMSTAGQSPFLSVFMYLGEVEDERTKADLALIIEEVLKQRMLGTKNKNGIYRAPAFPKLLYVLEEDNAYEGSKYFYLTKLSAECTAKRLVPDYMSEKEMKRLKEGNMYPTMGCRSILSPYKDAEDNYKFYGRINAGVVTLSLPDAALSADGSMLKFWKLMDERTELVHEALLARHHRLRGVYSDVAPILWQHGAYASLQPGETIDSLLTNGYSTISLGYAGLHEAVKALTGETHTSGEGKELAMQIMQYLNDKTDEWNEKENLGFSVYGSPIESTTYKFAKCLRKRFGIVEGITDRDYITNSYHVHVSEPIDAFSKLKLESAFQEMSPGGAISYVEVPAMYKNIPALISIIQYIYENILYAEINTKADNCLSCGFEGEILINEDLEWYCPSCKNKDEETMQVTRRTCG